MKKLLKTFGLTLFCFVTLDAATEATVMFNTSDSQFDLGVNNQGWWSTSRSASNTNDNYVIGSRINNFFTFDLGSLARPVASATLEVTRFGYRGEATETVEFFDVNTDAAMLNNNTGTSEPIFDDLGTGTSYGQFVVSNIGSSGDLLSFPLNAAAVADINGAAGGFFSVGGSLISDDGGDSLFGGSSQGGIQRLVMEVVPEPSSGMLVIVACCLWGATRFTFHYRDWHGSMLS